MLCLEIVIWSLLVLVLVPFVTFAGWTVSSWDLLAVSESSGGKCSFYGESERERERDWSLKDTVKFPLYLPQLKISSFSVWMQDQVSQDNDKSNYLFLVVLSNEINLSRKY